MKKFTPMKANAVNYKKMLLEGYIIKFDGGGHDFIEVIERENMDNWTLEQNVGRNNGKHFPYAPFLVEKAVEELKAEGYIPVKKRCERCGCCQYCASYYYLA